MSELQTEQEHRNQEYKDSLSDIEKTYQKQIDSLKEHLQRIVTESHQKDDLIEQVSGCQLFVAQLVVIITIPGV